MHRVVEGQAFPAPDDKLFVVTGVGFVDSLGDNFDILFDGQTVFQSVPKPEFEGMLIIGPGIVAQPSTVVEVATIVGSGHTAVLLGYLADA